MIIHTSYSIGASSTTATMVIHIVFLSLSLPPSSLPSPLSLSISLFLPLPLSLLVCLSVCILPPRFLSLWSPSSDYFCSSQPSKNKFWWVPETPVSIKCESLPSHKLTATINAMLTKCKCLLISDSNDPLCK